MLASKIVHSKKGQSLNMPPCDVDKSVTDVFGDFLAVKVWDGVDFHSGIGRRIRGNKPCSQLGNMNFGLVPAIHLR